MTESLHRYLLEGEKVGAGYVLQLSLLARSGRSGYYPGRYSGSSLDFKDFREYQPGDDLRQIDWGAYGRSDKLVVKLFREEIDPHVDFIIDGSRSMALSGTAKAGAVLGMSALLGVAANNARCTSAVWLSSQGCRRIDHGDSQPSLWRNITFKSSYAMAESFAMRPPALRRRGIRILLSDLLFPGEPREVLRTVALGASAVVVIQILADTDINPELQGNLSVEDCETGETVALFADAATRKRYDSALKALQQSWRSACRQVGAHFMTFNAEQLVSGWNVEALINSGVVGGL